MMDVDEGDTDEDDEPEEEVDDHQNLSHAISDILILCTYSV